MLNGWYNNLKGVLDHYPDIDDGKNRKLTEWMKNEDKHKNNNEGSHS